MPRPTRRLPQARLAHNSSEDSQIFLAPRRSGCAHLPALLIVNLGTLQTVAVVDVKALPLPIKIERGHCGLAVAVPRLLDSSEGEVGFGSDGGSVDIDDASFEIAHGAEGLVHVTRVDGGGQTVDHAVGHLQRLVETVDRDQRYDRAEDLLLGNAH